MSNENIPESGSDSIVRYFPGMRPDETLRNVFVAIIYFVTMFAWLPLLPFIAAVFVWRNWFGWSVALDRLPGVAGAGGARSGAVTFVYGFVLLVVLGTALSGAAPAESVSAPVDDLTEEPVDGQTPTPTSSDTDLITKESAAMLPTLDDFNAGWIENKQDRANETAFYNLDSDTVVFFRVSKFESVAAAETAYTDRRQEVRQDGLSSESVDVGQEGFLYKYDRSYIVVNFRVENVVGQVEFDGPRVTTPETNSIRFARQLEKKITN